MRAMSDVPTLGAAEIIGQLRGPELPLLFLGRAFCGGPVVAVHGTWFGTPTTEDLELLVKACGLLSLPGRRFIDTRRAPRPDSQQENACTGTLTLPSAGKGSPRRLASHNEPARVRV